MTCHRVRESIFELGRISTDRSITNTTLLRRLADVLADTLGVEIAGLAVFESGVASGSTACYVRGPWKMDESARFSEESFWAVQDRNLAERLEGLRRGRLHHRPDLLSPGVPTRMGSGRGGALPAAAPLEDQAVALFQRTDGAELLIGINSLDGSGQLSHTVLARAGALMPFVARCWATVWRREPAWMRDLKPAARRVLECLLEGMDDAQIADHTGLSYHSVRAHLKRFFRDADVRSRLHLMQQCACRAAEGSLVESPVDLSTDEAAVA